MKALTSLLAPFCLFFLVAATPISMQDTPPTPKPDNKCCEKARIFSGSVVGSPLCTRTDCRVNPIARCNGLVARDSVANAKCNTREGGTCKADGMDSDVHLSSQVHCDAERCIPDPQKPHIEGTKCVVTEAPDEPQVEIPYNKCAEGFTKCEDN